MKGKTMFSALALMAVVLVVAAGAVSAFGGGMFGKNADNRDNAMQDGMRKGCGMKGNGPMMNDESHEAIQAAVEAGDYSAWKQAVIDTLTEERFNEMVERHNAMAEQREKHEAVRTAIEAGDYEAWQEAVANLDHPNEDLITSAEDFEKMVEMHNAMESGDHKTAQQIREELGFGMGRMQNKGFGKGMGRA